ncbi:MAG TPA: TlpA disulfide reductase family protein [Bryobacteraceae bacterium]|jgi:peroxiredoxin|nr:TlpA disulfide reductase family protein [Bryobacteraceae bacterium]
MRSVKIDRFLRLGIGLLAVVLVYVLYAAIHQRVVEAGDTAPDFSITADNGRTVTLPNFGGKVLLLNFWASWCGPCAEETPSLSQLAKDYASKGVVVLGVSVDKDPQAYQRFLQKYSPAFLTVRDLKLHEEYGTFMYPETYIIDAKGHVALKIAEPADWMNPNLTKIIDSLL